MDDHRLRVLLPRKLHVKQHQADSIFEVVTRPNDVSSSWKIQQIHSINRRSFI